MSARWSSSKRFRRAIRGSALPPKGNQFLDVPLCFRSVGTAWRFRLYFDWWSAVKCWWFLRLPIVVSAGNCIWHPRSCLAGLIRVVLRQSGGLGERSSSRFCILESLCCYISFVLPWSWINKREGIWCANCYHGISDAVLSPLPSSLLCFILIISILYIFAWAVWSRAIRHLL